MAKDPAFPFYAQDYLVDTIRWSRAMQGLHVSLIAESWANGGLADQDGAPEGLGPTDVELWLKIKHKWRLVEGKWISDKLEEARAARNTFKQKQREKGILSGQKRTTVQPKHQPKTNHGSTVVEPLESEKENKEEKRREENTHTVECLCSVFGKKYKIPTERMPAEAGFFRDIDAQYGKLKEVFKTDEAIVSQVSAYLKHCEQTKRKRIGTAHKLAETIIQSDWIVLTGGNISPPEVTTTAYSAAERRRQEWTPEAWEEFYKDQLRDNKFRKHFGYGELRSSTPMGGDG